MLLFRVRGTIREQESDIGLSGLLIKAYDKDLVYDDLMGATHSAFGGSFDIVSEASDFRDFLEVRPDIYLKIFSADGETLLYSTEDAVRWQGTSVEEFHVQVPRECLGDRAPPRELVLTGDDGGPRTPGTPATR